MAQPTLYAQLESTIAPLDEGEKYKEIIKIEKELVASLKDNLTSTNLLEGFDRSIIPTELMSNSRKSVKPKVDPLLRLKELQGDEPDEEEEPEDEEEEDEEETAVEDEEDDAGGDYIVSHFDNGEGYEDNDDEGEPGELAA